MKISIILAVYNGANDIEKCLNSLHNQTYRNIEIICVDDGSTDNTGEILERHAAIDDRMRVFYQGENKQLLCAIKRGVSEATGDYIMFIDDDDWYENCACERISEVAAEDSTDIIFFGTNIYKNGTLATDAQLGNNTLKWRNSVNFKYSGENTLEVDGIDYIYVWHRAVRSDICKKAYGSMPDVRMNYYSDMYACQLMHYLGKSLVSISDKLVNHNYMYGETAQAMTSERFEYSLQCARLYEDGVSKFFRDQNAENELKRFTDKYIDRVLFYVQRWRDELPESDIVPAFESLIKYYGAENVLMRLRRNYRKVNNDCLKYKKQAEQKSKKKISFKKRVIRKLKRMISGDK